MKLTTILLVLLAVPLTASAQVAFPADAAYAPLRCGNGSAMTDPFADVTGSLDERDVVGDATHAAGLRASDPTNLYLRLRLEEDPAPGGTPSPFYWGMEFDINGSPNTYEILILVDGTQNTVSLFRNTTATVANSPTDPADVPVVATYPFAMNARSIAAAGTTFGGSGDFVLDFAVPWSALVPLGLDRDTPTHVWAASSSNPISLNGDFACHDPATDGAVTLDGTASDQTTGDPANDPIVPIVPEEVRLEGGAGCAASGGSPWWLGLALVPLWRRRKHDLATRRARCVDPG